MPAWRRSLVTAGANCAGFIMLMLGFRMRVRGQENVAQAKELGAVSPQLPSPTAYQIVADPQCWSVTRPHF